MSTINPNQGIPGSDQTTGDVLGGGQENQQFGNQMQDFNQFLFVHNDEGLDGSAMEATGTPGEYILTTGDGEQFKVINTDEVGQTSFKVGEGEEDNPNLVLGGTGDADIEGSDQDNQLMGNLGDNVINGGAGDDLLGGGEGDDELLGGDGNDTLLGDAGDDQLTGGEGENTFIYEINLPPDAEENEDYKFGDDKITDFGDGDTLILGDLNGDNAFNDFTFEEVNGNTLITFSDGRGSILLEGVGRDQISFNDQTGQVTFTGNANPQVATDQDPQNPDLDDDDDDIFTIV